MKKVSIFLAVVTLAFFAVNAIAEVPQMINYQGKLTNIEGEAVSDSTYVITFRIYDDSTMGAHMLWSEEDTVETKNGLLSLIFGKHDPIPFEVFDGSNRYLGIQVHGQGEIYPRTPLISVPYSYHAVNSDTALFALSGGAVSHWSVTDSVLYTNNFWGVARGGCGNILRDSVHTMVNLGVACTTGTGGSHIGYSTVGGGRGNAANGHGSSVGGGENNKAEHEYTTVGGGKSNFASAPYTTVGGGENNLVNGIYGTIGGGKDNFVDKTYATIPGGRDNEASGDVSFAAGRRAKALHDGAWVWADAEDSDFSSTADNQFLIRASGGVGIGTTEPQARLHIGGTPGVDGIMYPDGTLQTTAVAGTAGFLPSSAFNSGWVAINTNQTITFDHNLGYDPNDYKVDFQFKDVGHGLGINEAGYGQWTLGTTGQRHGAYYFNLTSNSISVWRAGYDTAADSIRVRIWIVQ